MAEDGAAYAVSQTATSSGSSLDGPKMGRSEGGTKMGNNSTLCIEAVLEAFVQGSRLARSVAGSHGSSISPVVDGEVFVSVQAGKSDVAPIFCSGLAPISPCGTRLARRAAFVSFLLKSPPN